MHVGGGRVARSAGVDDCDPSPGSAQDERGAETGGAATDDDDVVRTQIAGDLREERRVVRELGGVFEHESGGASDVASDAQGCDLDDLALPPGRGSCVMVGHVATVRLAADVALTLH